MGNLHLVTGTKGKKHVTSADHASFHAAIFGEGQYVLNRGSRFATTTVTNNQIRVADGDILMQGRHIRLNEGTYIDLTIENGTQGMLRNDLIVARYTKDSATGIEDCNLMVIKGTAAASNPVDPAYTDADIINDHVLLADMPLYRVPLDGLNVQELVPLFEEASLLADGSVKTNNLAPNAVTFDKIAKDAVSQTFTVTVPASGWMKYTNTCGQSVAVSGLKTTDTLIVDIDMTDVSNGIDMAAVSEAWSAIYKAKCSTNGYLFLEFALDGLPEIDIPVKVVAIRK